MDQFHLAALKIGETLSLPDGYKIETVLKQSQAKLIAILNPKNHILHEKNEYEPVSFGSDQVSILQARKHKQE